MHRKLFLLLVLLASSPVLARAQDFMVEALSLSGYTINGIEDPSIPLVRGQTYAFNIDASGHPFWIKTAPVAGTGSPYNNGVSANGVQIGTITWTVPADAPSTLYYACQIHATMSGTFTITGGCPEPPAPVWTNLGLSGPSPRENGAVTHDPVRNRMIIFGGTNAGTSNNEVWALSLSGSPSWTQLSPFADAPPSPRQWLSGVYDPARDRIIYIGGYDQNGNYLNEVWALSLAVTPAWIPLNPIGEAFPGRAGYAAVFDPDGDRVIAFSGAPEAGSTTTATVWSLSFKSNPPMWSQLSPPPSGTPPTARSSSTAIYDPVRKLIWIFGGWDGTTRFNETWRLLLGPSPHWSQFLPLNPPIGRSSASGIYDPTNDRMIVFGGWNGTQTVDDLLFLHLNSNAAHWTSIDPCLSPAPRSAHFAVHDGSGNRILLFGGWSPSATYGDTWVLRPVSLVEVSPNPKGASSMMKLYPNPTAVGLTIGFTAPRTARGSLRVLDLSGRCVRTLLEGSISAGAHNVEWDGNGTTGARVKPGVYYCDLQMGGQRTLRKAVLWR